MKKIFFLLVFSSFISLFAQEEQNITGYLRLIEAGQKEDVVKQLPDLLAKYPKDPSVKFLSAVLNENGEAAAHIYDEIIQNHPKSRYADASMYRLFSYYFVAGHYNISKKYAEMLKQSFPSSPYIKLLNAQIPVQNNPIVELPEVKDEPKEIVKKEDVKKEEVKQVEKKKEPVIEQKPVVKNESKDLGENYKFVIQAGAFSKKENAFNLKKSLEKEGYYVEVKEKMIGGSPFQVVYTGKFNTKAEAEKVIVVLKSDFEISGRIIPKEKK